MYEKYLTYTSSRVGFYFYFFFFQAKPSQAKQGPLPGQVAVCRNMTVKPNPVLVNPESVMEATWFAGALPPTTHAPLPTTHAPPPTTKPPPPQQKSQQ